MREREPHTQQKRESSCAARERSTPAGLPLSGTLLACGNAVNDRPSGELAVGITAAISRASCRTWLRSNGLLLLRINHRASFAALPSRRRVPLRPPRL